MAPTATTTYWDSETRDAGPKSSLKKGVQTSGQHPPVYEDLQPYETFPQNINGPTVWRKEDYEGNAERWTHRFTPDEVAELGRAADKFRESGIPLTTISKVRYSH